MRWFVEITYRTDTGPTVVEHFVEELDEVADIVERGPDWNTIVDIRITLERVRSVGLTVEQSLKI